MISKRAKEDEVTPRIIASLLLPKNHKQNNFANRIISEDVKHSLEIILRNHNAWSQVQST